MLDLFSQIRAPQVPSDAQHDDLVLKNDIRGAVPVASCVWLLTILEPRFTVCDRSQSSDPIVCILQKPQDNSLNLDHDAASGAANHVLARNLSASLPTSLAATCVRRTTVIIGYALLGK
jgi:hypothetical protein